MKGLSRLALGLVALVLMVAAPLLRGGTIRFDVIAGYGNVAPQNAWYPLTFELQNTGAPINAIIEISSDRLVQAPTRRLKLELPSNTTKRVVLPVFSAMRYNNESVRLLDEKGRILAEPNFIGSQTGGRPVLGFLSRASTGVPTLPEIKSRNVDSQPIVSRLQQELFPDNPIVLDGLPCIYLNSERAMALTVPQVTALLAWIQHGGHLIIGAEQIGDLTSREWIRTLLPFEPASAGVLASRNELGDWIRDYVAVSESDSENPIPQPVRPQNIQPRRNNTRNSPNARAVKPAEPIQLDEDAAFETASMPIVTGRVRDGKILIGTASSPLAIQAQRGRGKVTLLTFSPEREPFLSWKNRGWFWAKISNVPSSLYKRRDSTPNYNWMSSDGMFGWMVDSKQVRKLPLGWLLALLAAYLVVIGPMDQYVLKKAKRQMLTWITFPIYVVAFSGLIYFIGFYLRAGDLECNELTILDVLPNSQLAHQTVPTNGVVTVDSDTAVLRGQTYCSIYSPVNSHYPLKGGQPFAALRGELRGMGRGQSTGAEIMQHGSGFDADAFVAVWTSELFISDWLDRANNPLGVTIQTQGKDWQVSVDNQTGHALKDVRIVLGQRIYTLGRVVSGKNNFTLIREQGRVLFDFVNTVAPSLQGAAQSRHSNFREPYIAAIDPADASMAACFPSLFNNSPQRDWYGGGFNAPPGLDLSDYVAYGNAVLLAYDENKSYSTQLSQFKARRMRTDTLLRLVIPMPGSTTDIPVQPRY